MKGHISRIMDKCARCGDDTHILVQGGKPKDWYCYPCRQAKNAEGTGEKFPFNFLWDDTDEELERLEEYIEQSRSIPKRTP